MTMIEKVARAIAVQVQINQGYQYPTDDNWQINHAVAKAAIKAMREPTEEMECAVLVEGRNEIYQLMIDAALNGG